MRGASLFSYSRSARQARPAVHHRQFAPACGTSALRPPPQSGGGHSGRQRPPRSPGPSDGPGRRTGWPWASATGGQGGSGRIADIPRRGLAERCGDAPLRASRSSLTPAQPIILRIRASMSTTGERNSAPARGASGYASRPNQAPGWSRRAPPGPICPALRQGAPQLRHHLPGTRAAASDSRSPWPGRSTLTVCHPASAAAAAKNATSALLPPWPWR